MVEARPCPACGHVNTVAAEACVNCGEPLPAVIEQRTLGQLRHEPSLVDRYSDLTRHAVFYLDPHVCLRCRYRSTELLWQCPHCHDWNTFVEERIATAQDTTEVEV